MRPWRPIGSTRLQRCGIFDLDQVRFEPPGGGASRAFYRIEAPNWINVIPLTSDDRVLLVRQFRFGIEEFTLEIPGGMCDPGETPAQAAQRELLEETGYEPGEMLELGWVYPNPAVQNNRCYTFLASDVRCIDRPRPDPCEAFEQEAVPLDRIPDLITEGKITHSLVVAAFHLLRTRKG